MRDLLDVLGACARATPSLLGFTVWGMNDIHKKLRPLACAQKDNPRCHYFVKVTACVRAFIQCVQCVRACVPSYLLIGPCLFPVHSRWT